MADWIERLDNLLKLNGRELLAHAGQISHEIAVKKSGEEYRKFKSALASDEKEHSLKEIEEDIKRLKKGNQQFESNKIGYRHLIRQYIQKQKSGVTKTEIRDFLWEKLPDVLSDSKKVNKVTNLLQELRREEKIINQGTDNKSFCISAD